ncbi:UDP-glycosyltransferase 91C1-like isoform X2 [Phragmites australis]|uniref:UDP-glycosyltransferase 91C1-like isoform X2 n=1 Tax=Phragmites australis TaxID=29695 RepID=UPI002D767E64|nr:UDP-glycosyltransferase 91C1-like isoform X2 [Phragmites australis]
MDAGSSSSPPLRIVIFPWLAFGHLHPYLELAERLASRGHRVSFVSTPRNIARLPPLRPAAAPRVDLVALTLPHVDGLPDGAESTNNVASDKFVLLFKAFDGLAAPFAEFLGAACADDGRRPDWIIVDSFHHWVATAAVEHKVPCAMLLPTAALLAAVASRSSEPSVEERPAAVPRYELEQMARVHTNHCAQGMSIAQRYSLTLERCTLTAMRSCLEWEPESFPLVAAILGKPLVPLGLLPPSPDGGRGASMGGEDATVRWLDAQPPKSVVYIALGSEVPLRMEQVHELALGLELAGTRFLWALRKPGGVPDTDILPPGFQERTHGHGFVTMGWVPQISILAHGAVGAFLTHCGRNSLIEGLLFGHPLIMLPIFGDQGPNARQMEGKKVGLQVKRDENDGSFDRDGVASAVRAVMLEEEARGVFVANALKVQEIVADEELHERSMLPIRMK